MMGRSIIRILKIMTNKTRTPKKTTKISSHAFNPSARTIMLPEKREKYKKASQAEQSQEDVAGCSGEERKRKSLDQERTFRELPVSLREEELVENGERRVKRDKKEEQQNDAERNGCYPTTAKKLFQHVRLFSRIGQEEREND